MIGKILKGWMGGKAADAPAATDIPDAATSAAAQSMRDAATSGPSLLETLRRTPLHPVYKADALLELLPRWRELRQRLFNLSQVDERYFDRFYLVAIREFAERVQFLPASESHHHAYPLGQLEHTLETVEQAMIRRRPLLLPVGAEPERVSQEALIWTYAVFCAALCHDVGKPLARFILQVRDASGKWVEYSPAGESFVGFGATEYRADWNRANEYEYHHRIAPSLFAEIIPARGRAWLGRCPAAFRQVMAYLYGDDYNCGIIGEIIHAADGASTASNLGMKAPTGTAMGGEQTMPLHKRAELALRDMAKAWVINGRTSKTQGNVSGSDAWVVGDYVFTRSNMVNDLHARLCSQDSTGIPEPALLLTRLADMSLCLSYTDAGKSRSVFYSHIQSADGVSVAKDFSMLIFPVDRLFALRDRPAQFDGRIEIVKPVLPPTHVLSLHTRPGVAPGPAMKRDAEAAAVAAQEANKATPASAEPSPAPIPAQAQAAAPTHPPATAPVTVDASPDAFFDSLMGKSAAPATTVEALPSPATAEDTPHLAPAQPTIAADPQEQADSSATTPAQWSDSDLEQPDVDATKPHDSDSSSSGGPRRFNATGDYLPSDHAENDPPIVAAFFDWLSEGLATISTENVGQTTITFNRRGALLHGVGDIPDSIGIVTPKAFNEFLAKRGYTFGPGEYTTPEGAPLDGLSAELHHLQNLFRKSRWAIHNAADPGKNVFTYLIQAGQDQPSSLSLVIAGAGAGSKILPPGMAWQANAALVRSSPQEVDLLKREWKASRGKAAPEKATLATFAQSTPTRVEDRKPDERKRDAKSKSKSGGKLDVGIAGDPLA